MGTITNAVIAGLELRQRRERMQADQAAQQMQAAQHQFELDQRRQERMFQQAQAISQYRETRRDKLAVDQTRDIERIMDLTKQLQGIRAQANSEQLLMGSVSPNTKQSLDELGSLYKAFGQGISRRQQQLDSDDDSIERLIAISSGGGAGASAGTAGEEAAAPTTEAAPTEDGGPAIDEGAEMGPEQDFLGKIQAGLESRGITGGVRKGGMLRFVVDTDDEAKEYQDQIAAAQDELKIKIPALVTSREPALLKATENYFNLRDDQRQFNNRIHSYSAALSDPKKDALSAFYKSAQESGDDEQMNVFFSAMNASEEQRKTILKAAIKSAETARDEDKELLDLSKSAADEWYRIRGLGPIQDSTAAPKSVAAPAPAETEGGPPLGMNRQQFGKWYVENVSSNPNDLQKLKDAWTQYSSGG